MRIILFILVLCGIAHAQTLNLLKSGSSAPVAVSSFVGPGDIVSGAVFYFGGQAYSGAYASGAGKAFNVCLAGDSACADLVFGNDGKVVDGLVGGSHCSAVTCTIKTMYDQSGSSSCSGPCDITQATEGNRAKLLFSGGLAYADCTSSACGSYTSAAGFSSAVTQPYSLLVMVLYSDIGSIQHQVDCGFMQSWVDRLAAITFGIFEGTDTLLFDASASTGAFHAITSIYNGASSNIDVDGSTTTGTVGTNSACTGTSAPVIGLSTAFTGKWGPIGLWPSGFSGANQTSINSNIHSFWGF